MAGIDSKRFGCHVLAFDGTVLATDADWGKITRLSGSEFIGRNYLDFVAPMDRNASWFAFQRLLEHDGDLRIKKRRLQHDGVVSEISISATVIPAIGLSSPLVCCVCMPLASQARPRITDREALVGAIEELAGHLKALTAEYHLPFMSHLLALVQLEAKETLKTTLH